MKTFRMLIESESNDEFTFSFNLSKFGGTFGRDFINYKTEFKNDKFIIDVTFTNIGFSDFRAKLVDFFSNFFILADYTSTRNVFNSKMTDLMIMLKNNERVFKSPDDFFADSNKKSFLVTFQEIDVKTL